MKRRYATVYRRDRGFTLMELLIAVAIFAVVLAAINSVFYSALRLRNTTTRAIEEALPLQRAIEVIRGDLANIVPPGGALFGDLQSRPSSASLTGQISPDFYTSNALIDDYAPWGDVQRVAYLLVESDENTGRRNLVRVVWRNLLPPAIDEPEEARWLLGNIDEVLFFYHDGLQWRDSWDSTVDEPSLPRAVKVQIYRESDAAVRAVLDPVEIVVPLAVRGATNNLTQTAGGIR